MATPIATMGNWFRSMARPFSQNPVVARDLRVQLRGTRAYGQIALYLFLLGLLAVAGYSQAAGQSGNGSNVVQMQGKLQGFYQFIFYTLAALITLIAPALTAASITSEKQRQTFDLLLTTPLSAIELLSGKLMSSIAFIGLLLFLSLPASALCVLLGGATIWDVFQVYLFFALSGLLFAAIGLYFSCSSRNSLEAITWTYLTLLFLLGFSSPLIAIGYAPSTTPGLSNNPLFAVAGLNPFAAVTVGGKFIGLFGVNLPASVGTAFLAFLIIRLLMTSATLKLARFGNSAMPSLRRQVLFLTAMVIGITFYAVVQVGGASSAMSAINGMLIIFFIPTIFFLPAMFTPTVAEDAPAGTKVVGAFDVRKMFSSEHSGALPYFYLWLVVFVGSAITGVLINSWISSFASGATSGGIVALGLSGSTPLSMEMLIASTLLCGFYLSGLAFLLWCLSRRAAVWVVGASAGRALSFGMMVLIVMFPIMIAVTTSQNIADSVWQDFWLLKPLTKVFSNKTDELLTLFPIYGGAAYLLGILFYPPWKSVEPALPKLVVKSKQASANPNQGTQPTSAP